MTTSEPVDMVALLERAENYADLNDADIATLREDLAAAGLALVTDPDAVTDEALNQAQQIRDTVQYLRAVEAQREAAASERAERAATIAAELAAPVADARPGDDEDEVEHTESTETTETDDGDGTTTTETTETERTETHAEEVVQPIAASFTGNAVNNTTNTAAARTKVRRPEATRPRVPAAREMVLRASSNVPGVNAGQELNTPELIMNAVDGALRASAGHRGPRMEIPLFSLGSPNPEEIFGASRTLGRDAQTNEERINAVTSPKALRASGGICAPAPVQYDLPIIGTDERPVKQALANFGVPRGGIRLLTPPTMSDVTGAIGIWTAANDLSPSSPTTKPCITLDCPNEVQTDLAAITQCLRVGNFRSRFFPEQIEAWTRLVAIQLARIAETRILQKIGDLSTQVAVTEVLGTTPTILATMDRVGAQLRSRNRISPDAPLRLLAPAWLLDNMLSDLARRMPGDGTLSVTDAQINGWFAARNINVSWFLDGEAGQIFGAQSDGNAVGWPDEVVTYLYVEGSWLYLDGGMLDFGIVRDSTLNSTNDMEIFSEIFEEAAFHGPAGTSYRLAIDICPNGQAAALDDTSGLCTSGS